MKYLYLMLLLALMTACTGQQKEKEENTTKLVFEPIVIPSMITDPGERASYFITHYWDKFNFSDTAYIHIPEVTEQAFTDYINLLNHVAPQIVFSSIKDMLKKAESEPLVFEYFTELFERYLYDPNSPFRNEEYYIPVLEEIIASPLTDETEKIRPAHLLELALKNRLREKANDFIYTLANGQKGKLYNVVSDYLILYFYNPDCDACREVSHMLTGSLMIKYFQQKKLLKILAIYPDEDLTAWKEHLKSIPSEWINGYDQAVTLKNDEIYDLKAIPTLYLLNREKIVLLKDPTFRQLEEYLHSLQTNNNL